MKRTYILQNLIVIVILAFSFISCEDFFSCKDGNGNLTSETRSLSNFSAIKNSTSFTVRITHDSIFSVRVEADEDLIDLIKTSLDGNALEIYTESDRCINSDNDIVINIHMPSIELVEQTGSGYIAASDFNCNILHVRNTGSGDIDLLNIHSNNVDIMLSGSGSVSISGSANSGSFNLTGSGKINTDNLPLNFCSIIVSGSGDVYCYVMEILDVTITGSGDVFYSGDPELTVNNTGSGEVIKRN